MNEVDRNHTARSLADIASEMKRELKEFAETRFELFKSELREKTANWKTAAPMAAVGIVLLGTSYLLITATIVALAAVLIGDTPYRWVFALLGGGVLWGLLGGIALYIAKREFKLTRLVPQRTIAVLKEDKAWLESEARQQI